MLQFFYLMLRDHVRIITGVFHHGHRYVDPVMAFLHGKGYCESWTMACAGLFDEIVVVLINYNDGDPPAQLKRNQVLDGIDQTYFGVPGNDCDSHAPLLFDVEAEERCEVCADTRVQAGLRPHYSKRRRRCIICHEYRALPDCDPERCYIRSFGGCNDCVGNRIEEFFNLPTVVSLHIVRFLQ